MAFGMRWGGEGGTAVQGVCGAPGVTARGHDRKTSKERPKISETRRGRGRGIRWS